MSNIPMQLCTLHSMSLFYLQRQFDAVLSGSHVESWTFLFRLVVRVEIEIEIELALLVEVLVAFHCHSSLISLLPHF